MDQSKMIKYTKDGGFVKDNSLFFLGIWGELSLRGSCVVL